MGDVKNAKRNCLSTERLEAFLLSKQDGQNTELSAELLKIVKELGDKPDTFLFNNQLLESKRYRKDELINTQTKQRKVPLVL